MKNEDIILYIAHILLYFIMIPTSKYSIMAANIFIDMAKEQTTSTTLIYSQNKKQLSETIIKLCVINQALINYNLTTSLEQISLILGYYGPTDFVTKESRYLLPILISMVPNQPKVGELLQELASLSQITLSNLVKNKYAYIFLYLFLHKPEDIFKRAINYVEGFMETSAQALSKKDSYVILNELLLHFHEKRDRVLAGLKILAGDEINMISEKQIPDYLQSKLLGVLVYFDMKLVSRPKEKNTVLLSLAELLQFMGAKYVTPLRFKIFATLKTALNCPPYTTSTSAVWEAFVRSCDIDALSPQLASIFISLGPLRFLHGAVHRIFTYLVVENEMHVKEYIPDLFFAVDWYNESSVGRVLKKHMEVIEKLPFKKQIKFYLKYLNNENVYIQYHGLDYMKKLLRKHREELDEIILGYNGIDPVIVKLVDALMVCCRHKERLVKLACAECIGELGAIEPSHFPRR